MRTWVAASLGVLLLVPFAFTHESEAPRFTPAHKLSGFGADRQDIADDVLAIRSDLMVQSQTFAIMRDAQAIPGLARVSAPKLQALYKDAERQSGFPARTLEAMSYLESWGVPNAESPSGPKGIMQIAEGTARSMGLKVIHATRYKVSTTTKVVKGKKRTTRTRTPYTVTVRDDRLVPERAIPAAALYLARLQQKFDGQDWAIFAYHCGEGCVSYLRSIAEMANGFRGHTLTVARMFFNCSPAYNRNLYQAVQQQMQRDFSPTYWFRVMRAQELLALGRSDPDRFRKMADDYHSEIVTALRAPNRLSVWLRANDLAYRTSADVRADQGKRLVKAFDNPDYFGYRVRPSEELNQLASPAAVGTLAYIAYETRRVWDRMNAAPATFQPLEVTALVRPDITDPETNPEVVGHSSGQVFDIDLHSLPPAEAECLRFVLDDLGWFGYLGFTEESAGASHIHVGCSPSSRDFFAQVYQDGQSSTAVAQGPPTVSPAPSSDRTRPVEP